MDYKIANIVRISCMLLGISISALSILFLGTEKNVFFILGIIITIIGLIIGFVFYTCPNCGHPLITRPIILKHCQNCGYELNQ